jgi:hypothetical protein
MRGDLLRSLSAVPATVLVCGAAIVTDSLALRALFVAVTLVISYTAARLGLDIRRRTLVQTLEADRSRALQDLELERSRFMQTLDLNRLQAIQSAELENLRRAIAADAVAA